MDLRRAAPLGSFGLIAGLAAAATFLPDGCTITAEGSQHLREGVPIVTPLLFGLLGLVLAERARWGVLQALVAIAAWSLVVAVLGTGKPQDLPFATLALWPFCVAALALPAILTRQPNPWPWIAALSGVALAMLWTGSRHPPGETLDFGLAWSALGAQAFMTIVAALHAPRPWRAKVVGLLACAVAGLAVGAYVVLHAPKMAPARDAPFSLWHGC